MIIIGVTGGIGSGKSSVSAILGELGAVVLDADAISKEVVEPGRPALKQIAESFGEGVILPDGSLNRKAMADLVFVDRESKLALEKIIHSQVLDEMKRSLDALALENRNGVVVLDVPIPVRHGFLDTVDVVWAVVCPDEERIRRVMKRSGLAYDDAKKRIASQMSQEEYGNLAHEIIENDATLEDLKLRVTNLFKDLLARKGHAAP